MKSCAHSMNGTVCRTMCQQRDPTHATCKPTFPHLTATGLWQVDNANYAVNIASPWVIHIWDWYVQLQSNASYCSGGGGGGDGGGGGGCGDGGGGKLYFEQSTQMQKYLTNSYTTLFIAARGTREAHGLIELETCADGTNSNKYHVRVHNTFVVTKFRICIASLSM